MSRLSVFVLAVMGALFVTLPEQGDAQVAVQVQVYWEWGDGGWRPHRVPHGARYDDYYYDDSYYAPARPIRVPPGHLPPPGLCRLWYPGRPPGHQPPPQRCGHLFRAYAPGAVIIGDPGYYDGYGRGQEFRGRGRGKKGKGKGKWK